MIEGDGVRAALERELYWATEGREGHEPSRTQSARLAAERLAHRLRREARQAAPWRDPGLVESRGWKRSAKLLLYRLLRPVSHRYDRIGSELAGITVQLADSLLQLERDVVRLRQDLGELEGRLREPDRSGGIEER
jgi:hypothetical protein